MAKTPVSKSNPLDELHGYDRQFYIVKNLPRMGQDETMQKLQVLATLTEGSPEWTNLRNNIVVGNLYFAYTVGNEYAVRFKKIADDCIQYASVGLIKAVEDYAKNGNGACFLPYAKTAICRAVKRNGVNPALKCGITYSRDVNNTAHNAEVDAKRQAKGKSAIEAVSVIADEQKDENGNSVNILDAMPSDTKDAFAELEEKERQETYETAVNTLLGKQDASIWRLRMQGLDWVSIARQVGLKRNATQMRFYSAKKRVEAYIASVK